MSISKSLLDVMTVQELRQYARNHGMSSITRLNARLHLVYAILRYETRQDGRGAGICCGHCYATTRGFCVNPSCLCHRDAIIRDLTAETPRLDVPSGVVYQPPLFAQPLTPPDARKPYHVTKWTLATRTEAWALEATKFEGECSYCGVWLRTEADFAKHFIIPDRRYRNTGDCPNKLAGAFPHDTQAEAGSDD